MHHREFIAILDFGSQYTQLIARRIREIGVYSEIFPFDVALDKINVPGLKGIVLSGGPASVYMENAPDVDTKVFSLGVPVLGICYGLQLIAKKFNGKVSKFAKREYGRAVLNVIDGSDLFSGVESGSTVWMSHGDALSKVPEGFEIIAETENSPICAIRNPTKKIYGVQFHPEVAHTEKGQKILENFVFKICGCKGDWKPESLVDKIIHDVREKVNGYGVICALSGGVDSTVLAVLLNRAIGDNLICVHINNGLMRSGESEEVVSLFKNKLGININYIDASDVFLSRLKGVVDPEKKRKIIGETFIEVFENEAGRFKNVKFLAQGTLYPDVIESTSHRGPSAKIKTHHNVGGLPEKMKFELIEPFRELFKDEVRRIGAFLGLPDEVINRHPFPGPGLAVRIIGEVTKEKLEILRKADKIFVSEIKKAGLYNKIWQSFAVLLPVRTVGVMGDERSYGYTIALRAVSSLDGMTADWVELPYEVLRKVSLRITNEVDGVNRVVYDVTSKPPSTIEWE